MKWTSNQKATSSATIIAALVIGTLVFSVSVAASMGALTFTFIPYEQLAITNITWEPDNTHCQITIENTGTADLSILTIRINGATPRNIDPTLMTPYGLKQGSSVAFTMTLLDSFNRGNSYEFTVVTTKGNSFSYSVKAA